MYLSSIVSEASVLLLLCTAVVLQHVHGLDFQLLEPDGLCVDGDGEGIDFIQWSGESIGSAELCKEKCTVCHDPVNGVILSGMAFMENPEGVKACACYFRNGSTFDDLGDNCRENYFNFDFESEANGVEKADPVDHVQCYKVDPNSYNPTLSPAIPSWDLEYKSESLVADFNRSSVDEITVTYKIGKDRDYVVTLLKSGCEESEIELTDDDGIELVSQNTEPIGGDPENTYLHLGFNVTKNATVLKDVYYVKDGAEDKTLNLCLKLQLLNSESEEVKSDKQELSIEFMFNNTFAIENVNLTQVFVGSDTVATNVLEYVEACACTSWENNDCSGEPITGEGDDDKVNVCIWSTSDEMEIDYLDRLVMNGNGEEMIIVDGGVLEFPDMSSMTYARGWNGVHAASVVKSDLYSYDDDVLAKVTGVVYLKLAGSTRRRIAVELTGGHESEVGSAGSSRSRALQSAGDQESAFAVNVALQKSELELDDAEVNGAGTWMSGAIGASVIGSAAAAIMMW